MGNTYDVCLSPTCPVCAGRKLDAALSSARAALAQRVAELEKETRTQAEWIEACGDPAFDVPRATKPLLARIAELERASLDLMRMLLHAAHRNHESSDGCAGCSEIAVALKEKT